MESEAKLERQLKKGSTELLILAILEDRDRHGYEIGKQIEQRSEGVLRYHAASLYPLLYRLEGKAWIKGRWVEKAGQRRRRYYRLTIAGQRALKKQRLTWRKFAAAVDHVVGVGYA